MAVESEAMAELETVDKLHTSNSNPIDKNKPEVRAWLNSQQNLCSTFHLVVLLELDEDGNFQWKSVEARQNCMGKETFVVPVGHSNHTVQVIHYCRLRLMPMACWPLAPMGWVKSGGGVLSSIPRSDFDNHVGQ